MAPSNLRSQSGMSLNIPDLLDREWQAFWLSVKSFTVYNPSRCLFHRSDATGFQYLPWVGWLIGSICALAFLGLQSLWDTGLAIWTMALGIWILGLFTRMALLISVMGWEEAGLQIKCCDHERFVSRHLRRTRSDH